MIFSPWDYDVLEINSALWIFEWLNAVIRVEGYHTKAEKQQMTAAAVAAAGDCEGDCLHEWPGEILASMLW